MDTTHSPVRPLDHIRVLDMSRIYAGPFTGQLLADLGAEVIKVERPVAGDDTRHWGPPFLKDAEGNDTVESGYFLCLNRGKKSVTVDLSRPEGQEIIRALAAQSDVLLENFLPGTLARYGLGWDDLRAANPRLVYCSVSGFGQTGPYRDRAAYDFIIQAMGGLMSITGESEDKPGGGPQKVGTPVVDLVTGLYATIAVQAALAAREKTGQGQYIDIGMLDVMVGSMGNQALNYLLTGTPPRCAGNDHPNIVPQRVFSTRDGRIAVVVGNDRQFAAFCEAAGCPALAADARFATNPQRVRFRPELDGLLEPLMATRGNAEWTAALQAAGVPCGPINDMAQVFADPQVRARGMQQELRHGLGETIPTLASPMRLSDTPVRFSGPPPMLGEHVDAVLGELLGMAPEKIEQLRADGII